MKVRYANMNDLREAAKKEHFCGFPKEVQVKRMRQIEENMILKNMMWMIRLKILLVNVSWHWMANLHLHKQRTYLPMYIWFV